MRVCLIAACIVIAVYQIGLVLSVSACVRVTAFLRVTHLPLAILVEPDTYFCLCSSGLVRTCLHVYDLFSVCQDPPLSCL